jgi:sialate O-acetylesterase
MIGLFSTYTDSSNILPTNILNSFFSKLNTHTLAKTIVVLMFLTLFTYSGIIAQNRLDLAGTWKFNIGDNMEWAKTDFNDKGWDEIKVGDEWENQGFQGYDGFAWYRVNVPIPLAKFSADEDFYLYLGRIDDADEVYFNGKLIGKSGSLPPNYSSAYERLRVYHIPRAFLSKNGQNLVAVRVYDDHGEGGILRDGEGIMIKTRQNMFGKGFNLEGLWKFATGDNLEWSNQAVDDTKWDEISVPATWEQQGYRDYDGKAWYRRNFFVPADYNVSETHVLVLGKIDDLDQAYLNGTLVGKTGNMETKSNWIKDEGWEYNHLRCYYLLNTKLQAGKVNTVAVRVYDTHAQGGIYKGPVGIVPLSSFVKYWRNNPNKKND